MSTSLCRRILGNFFDMARFSSIYLSITRPSRPRENAVTKPADAKERTPSARPECPASSRSSCGLVLQHWGLGVNGTVNSHVHTRAVGVPFRVRGHSLTRQGGCKRPSRDFLFTPKPEKHKDRKTSIAGQKTEKTTDFFGKKIATVPSASLSNWEVIFF